MSDAEKVGSVGEEAWKLWCALSGSAPETTAAPTDASAVSGDGLTADSDESHSCPTGWCPVCQVVDFVREHPEAVARVGASAASLLHSIRDLMSTPHPRGEQDPR